MPASPDYIMGFEPPSTSGFAESMTFLRVDIALAPLYFCCKADAGSSHRVDWVLSSCAGGFSFRMINP